MQLLSGYGITLSTMSSQSIKQTVKKNVVEIAKEWGTYFCRLYPVSGGQTNRVVQYLGVSHSGIRLIRREKTVTSDYLQVLETVTFDEIAETSVPKSSAVEIVLRTGGRLVLYSHRASQIQMMIMRYIVESEKVRAIQVKSGGGRNRAFFTCRHCTGTGKGGGEISRWQPFSLTFNRSSHGILIIHPERSVTRGSDREASASRQRWSIDIFRRTVATPCITNDVCSPPSLTRPNPQTLPGLRPRTRAAPRDSRISMTCDATIECDKDSRNGVGRTSAFR